MTDELARAMEARRMQDNWAREAQMQTSRERWQSFADDMGKPLAERRRLGKTIEQGKKKRKVTLEDEMRKCNSAQERAECLYQYGLKTAGRKPARDTSSDVMLKFTGTPVQRANALFAHALASSGKRGRVLVASTAPGA
jgi:hypothetical protein